MEQNLVQMARNYIQLEERVLGRLQDSRLQEPGAGGQASPPAFNALPLTPSLGLFPSPSQAHFPFAFSPSPLQASPPSPLLHLQP